MAVKWRRYETVAIFDPELGTEATEELIERARSFVVQESARVLKTERWGVRDLAFEMKGRPKGYYLLLEYAGPPQAATELDRRLRLLDTVLKFQTVKLEESVDPESLSEPEAEAAEAAEAAAAPASEEPDEEEQGEGENQSNDEKD